MSNRTLSYAALFGIRADLHLKGTNYSTLSSIFYVGWLAWALPGNLLLPKFPLSKYLAVNVSTVNPPSGFTTAAFDAPRQGQGT